MFLVASASPPVVRNGCAFPYSSLFRLGCALIGPHYNFDFKMVVDRRNILGIFSEQGRSPEKKARANGKAKSFFTTRGEAVGK
jgi:hypothetical protein